MARSARKNILKARKSIKSLANLLCAGKLKAGRQGSDRTMGEEKKGRRRKEEK